MTACLPPAPIFPQVRYVIDFYNAKPAPGQIIGMHLDVRPALDSPQARPPDPQLAVPVAALRLLAAAATVSAAWFLNRVPRSADRQALFDRLRMQCRWVASGRWKDEEGQEQQAGGAPPAAAAQPGGGGGGAAAAAAR